MSRFLLAVCVGSYVLIGGTTTMDGQEQRGDSTQYDARAIRVENRAGHRVLVRGRDGVVVGKVGEFRGLDLAVAVAPSPNAVREAVEFKRSYSRGNNLLAVGILAWGVGAGVSRIDDIDLVVSIPAWTAVVVGTFLTSYGARELNRAHSALARCIWWYNRDLPR